MVANTRKHAPRFRWILCLVTLAIVASSVVPALALPGRMAYHDEEGNIVIRDTNADPLGGGLLNPPESPTQNQNDDDQGEDEDDPRDDDRGNSRRGGFDLIDFLRSLLGQDAR